MKFSFFDPGLCVTSNDMISFVSTSNRTDCYLVKGVHPFIKSYSLASYKISYTVVLCIK